VIRSSPSATASLAPTNSAPDTIVRSALASARGTVSTGPCAR